MNIKYRKFKKNDLDTVKELIKSLYSEDPGYKQINDKKILKTFNELLNHPDKGEIKIIQNDNEIIGYCILINYWSNEYGGNIINIDELYIKVDYRNNGIGSNFIKYLINNHFNNAAAFQLEVLPDNNKAKKLYEGIGFKPCRNNHLIYEYI